GFTQDILVERRVFERPATGEAGRPGAIDCLFDGANLPLSHQRKVSQTVFDRPAIGGGTPVELRLGESGGQLFCVICNLLELPAILFKFVEHHLELCHLPGNSAQARSVYPSVKSRMLWVISLLIAIACGLGAAYSDYDSA